MKLLSSLALAALLVSIAGSQGFDRSDIVDHIVAKLSQIYSYAALLPRKNKGQSVYKSECTRSVIQECTCFEVLQVNSYRLKGQGISVGDIKKGIARQAKSFIIQIKAVRRAIFSLWFCVATN